MARKYFCGCPRFCKGGKYVCKATFYKHAPFRLQPGTPILSPRPRDAESDLVGMLVKLEDPSQLESPNHHEDETRTVSVTPSHNEDNIPWGSNTSAGLRTGTGNSPSDTVYFDPPFYRWSTNYHAELPPIYRRFATAPSTPRLIHDHSSQGHPHSQGADLSSKSVEDHRGKPENEREDVHENPKASLREKNRLASAVDQVNQFRGELRAFGDLTNANGGQASPAVDISRDCAPNESRCRPNQLTFIHTTMENFKEGYYKLETVGEHHDREEFVSRKADNSSKENDAPLYTLRPIPTVATPSEASASSTISSPAQHPGPLKADTPRVSWISSVTPQCLVDSRNRPCTDLYSDYQRLQTEQVHMHANYVRLHGEYGKLHQDWCHLQLAANFYMSEGDQVKNENLRLHHEIARLRGEILRLGGVP